MKKILEKRLARLTEQRDELTKRGLESADANEVRSINEQIKNINIEIEETRELIAHCEEEERKAESSAIEQRDSIPANATYVNPLASFKNENRDEEPYSSMEYRKAFMAYVQNGTLIPSELRSGDAISTAETGAAIPMTIMNEVINTVRKRYGNLYGKVRKLTIPGGVEFPIGALKASFKWINESTVSPRQKTDALSKISFGYHTAEIRIAQSFLSQIVTLSSFENRIAEVIAVAYLQNMDDGIVNGSGDGCMTGILNDARVTNSIQMSAEDISDWKKWRKNFFAQIPLGYKAGEFIFAASTVDAYLETMSDANGNPVFRQATGLEVNDGDATNPNGRFFGRNVALVEPDIIADFDTANVGDVIGIFWQPDEYAINENFGFTMRRYFDEETNEWVDKAIVVVDGKVLNPTGFYKILKK